LFDFQAFKDLGRLRRLRLYNNSLTAVPPAAAFAGLLRLYELDLNANQISVMARGALSYTGGEFPNDLDSLERLYMSDNPLWVRCPST